MPLAPWDDCLLAGASGGTSAARGTSAFIPRQSFGGGTARQVVFSEPQGRSLPSVCIPAPAYSRGLDKGTTHLLGSGPGLATGCSPLEVLQRLRSGPTETWAVGPGARRSGSRALMRLGDSLPSAPEEGGPSTSQPSASTFMQVLGSGDDALRGFTLTPGAGQSICRENKGCRSHDSP